MTSFCVRHREEYEKACRALTRMVANQTGRQGTGSGNGGRHRTWSGTASRATTSSGPDPRPEQADDSDSARGVLQKSLDSSEHVKVPTGASSHDELDPSKNNGISRTPMTRPGRPVTMMRKKSGLTPFRTSSRVGFSWRRLDWTCWRRASSSLTSSRGSPSRAWRTR